MKPSLILLFSALFVHSFIAAQEPANSFYCATNFSGITPYHIAANAKSEFEKSGTTLYIPITANLVGRDDGTGYHTLDRLLRDLCNLNTDFDEYGFHFYLENIIYIDNSEFFWMDTDTFLFQEPMYQFVENHNTPNTLNVYIVEQAGGYSFLAADWIEYIDYSDYPPVWLHLESHALVLDKQKLNSRDHLFTHEVGHYFGLWHNFQGGDWLLWSDTGAPDTIFFDIIYPDGDTIPYYRLIDRVDSLHCDVSGDLICDTPPDYLSFNWGCNENHESDPGQIDPAGVPFVSDGSYYMTYANDTCKSRFSDMQVDVMRNVAEGPGDYLLYDQTPPGSFSIDDLALFYPPEGSAVSPVSDSVILQWDMPGTEYFQLTYGVKPTPDIFFPVESDVLVEGNQYPISITNFDFEYFWIIKPISKYFHCGEMAADTSYFNAVLVSTEEIPQNEPLKIFPNPATDQVFLDFHDPVYSPESLEAVILDSQGRSIGRMPVLDMKINVAFLSAGIYFLKLTDGERVYAGKFVKQ